MGAQQERGQRPSSIQDYFVHLCQFLYRTTSTTFVWGRERESCVCMHRAHSPNCVYAPMRLCALHLTATLCNRMCVYV